MIFIKMDIFMRTNCRRMKRLIITKI